MYSCSPFVAKWLISAIHRTLENAPNTSNHHLKELLLLYSNDYALTKTILHQPNHWQKTWFLALPQQIANTSWHWKRRLAFVTIQLRLILWLCIGAQLFDVCRRKTAGTGDASVLGTNMGKSVDFINKHFWKGRWYLAINAGISFCNIDFNEDGIRLLFR